MHYELGRLWKEADMVYFNVLYQHLPGGTEKNHENVSHNSQPLSQESNLRPFECEVVVVNTSLQYTKTTQPNLTQPTP